MLGAEVVISRSRFTPRQRHAWLATHHARLWLDDTARKTNLNFSSQVSVREHIVGECERLDLACHRYRYDGDEQLLASTNSAPQWCSRHTWSGLFPEPFRQVDVCKGSPLLSYTRVV